MAKIATNPPILCDVLFADLLNGQHSDRHVYKVALYTKEAKVGKDTLRYASAGEVAGRGYTMTGKTLLSRSVAGGELKFGDVTWGNAEFIASHALVYNETSAGRAICVINLGGERIVQDGSFTLRLSDHPLIELTK